MAELINALTAGGILEIIWNKILFPIITTILLLLINYKLSAIITYLSKKKD